MNSPALKHLPQGLIVSDAVAGVKRTWATLAAVHARIASLPHPKCRHPSICVAGSRAAALGRQRVGCCLPGCSWTARGEPLLPGQPEEQRFQQIKAAYCCSSVLVSAIRCLGYRLLLDLDLSGRQPSRINQFTASSGLQTTTTAIRPRLLAAAFCARGSCCWKPRSVEAHAVCLPLPSLSNELLLYAAHLSAARLCWPHETLTLVATHQFNKRAPQKHL